MHLSDKTLVSQALSGDRQAFETLVSQHQGTVFAFVASRVQDLNTAEEITQRAFVEAFICLRTLREPEKFGSWTKGIALNVWRKGRTDRHIPTEETQLARLIDQNDGLVLKVLTTADAPDLAYEKQELKEVILREVGRLDENLSEVILLHYMEGLSYREISAILSVPESTIVGRLQSAREKLRDQLMPYVEETLQDRRPDVREKVMALLPFALFQPTDFLQKLRSTFGPKAVGLGGLAVAGSVASFIGLASVLNHVSGDASTQQTQPVALEFEKRQTITAEGEGKTLPDQPERTGDADPSKKPGIKIKTDKTSGEVTLNYTVPQSADISIRIFDRMGEEVAKSIDQSHKAGVYRVRVNTSGWQKGSYFLRFTSREGKPITKRFVKTAGGASTDDRREIRDLMNEAAMISTMRPRRAIEIFDKVLKEYPDYVDRGSVHFSSLFAHARVSSKDTIQTVIDSTLAWNTGTKTRLMIARQIGDIWPRTKNTHPMPEEALNQIEIALDPDRSGPTARQNKLIADGNQMRGLLYLKQGNDSLAIEALEATLSASRYLEEGPSLARNPEWRYTTYKELGLTYDRLGRPSKAIGALEAALEASEKMGPPGIAEVKAALKRLR